MKIVAIGDTHGRPIWKSIVEKNKGAHFVFLGDYLDPYSDYEDVDEIDALENLYEIIDFKSENPNSVTLLIGNHDAQYLYYPKFRCSQLISTQLLREAIDLFQDNKNLFQIAVQKDKYLFVHAGVTNGWVASNRDILDDFGLKLDMKNMAIVLNKMSKDSHSLELLLSVSYLRGGWELNGGPLWADKRELFKGHLIGFNQIVGHNKVDSIFTIGNSKSSVTFCDSLWHNEDYHTLNI